MKMKNTLLLLLMIINIAAFGQGIEPSSIQPSPYIDGILKAKIAYTNPFTGLTEYIYKHDTLPSDRTTTVLIERDKVNWEGRVIGDTTYLNIPFEGNINAGVRLGAGTKLVKNSTFIGFDAGKNVNAASDGNVAIGAYALQSSISATGGSGYNTGIGYQTGYNLTVGAENYFGGFRAGYSNTTGSYNFFGGSRAGYYNTTGGKNVFIGRDAGIFNTTGAENYFAGFSAGFFNTTGNNNVFGGALAGYYNTTGGSNFFAGSKAGFFNTTGNNNVFGGALAGYYNTTGGSNFFGGALAGYSNTTGNNNFFGGARAGYSNSTGSNNVFIGRDAGYYETLSNRLYISNSNKNTPLIGGDFNLTKLGVNKKIDDIAATLHVGGSVRVDTRVGMAATVGGYDSDGTLVHTLVGSGLDLTAGILNNTKPYSSDSTDVVPDYGILVNESPNQVFTLKVDSSKLATKFDLVKKQDTLISGVNIKTVQGQSVLGSGNVQIDGSETKVTAGTNVTVTGLGTTSSPYVVNSSGGGGGGGTVTSVGLSSGTSGTDINISGSPVTTSGTLNINIPTASATNRGALSSTDWNNFNLKVGGSGTATELAFFSGSNSIMSDNNLFFDNTNKRLGIGTSSPAQSLDVAGNARISGSTGTASDIMGRDASGDISNVTVGTGLSLTSGTLTNTGDLSDTNELQTISKSGNTVNLTSGGSFDISSTTPASNEYLKWNGSNWVASALSALTGSGTATQVAYWDGSSSLTSSSNLYWNNSNTRLGIGTSSPTQTLDVNGQGRIRTLTSGSNKIIGGSSSNVLTSISVGTGLSLSGDVLSNTGDLSNTNELQTISKSGNTVNLTSGGSFNISSTTPVTNEVLQWNGSNWVAGNVTAPNTWADLSGHIINWNATGSYNSGKPVGIGIMSATRQLDVNGTVRFRGQIFDSGNSAGSSGQVLTSAGAGNWYWSTPSGGTQNLSYGFKSGTDVPLDISGGVGVNFRESNNIELLRNGSNILGIRQRANWALIAIASHTLSLSTSNTKVSLLGGSAWNGDNVALSYDNTNYEIDIYQSGTYKVSVTAECKTNESSHTVTFDVINSATGTSLNGTSLQTKHYFNNTIEYSHNNKYWIFPITSGTSFYLVAKTDTGTPNINDCSINLLAEKLND